MIAPKAQLNQAYRPRDFRERGLLVPFTTPVLQGARLRQSASAANAVRKVESKVGDKVVTRNIQLPRLPASSTLELVVLNPSGARGVYIVPWGDLSALCSPTMHDVTLRNLLTKTLDQPGSPLTPGRILDVARKTALQGLAGRKTAEAAKVAAEQRTQAVAATHTTLVHLLTEQMEARGGPGLTAGQPLQQVAPAEVKRRSDLVMQALSNLMGRPQPIIEGALERLAQYYVDIGIGSNQKDARFPRLIANMERLQSDMAAWIKGCELQVAVTQAGDAAMSAAMAKKKADQASSAASASSGHRDLSARDAQAVAVAAELTARMGDVLLDTARGLTGDMMAVLDAMLNKPARVAIRCERPGWLLDGWEQVCVIWKSAPNLMSHALALQEIARQLPILPDEAEEWLGLPAGTAEQMFQRPTSQATAPSGETHILSTVARNEQLRALAF